MEEETTTALCSAIQFKKSETRTMPWTINDILGDDPLLKPVPVESEVNLQDRLPIGASALRAGYWRARSVFRVLFIKGVSRVDFLT